MVSVLAHGPTGQESDPGQCRHLNVYKVVCPCICSHPVQACLYYVYRRIHTSFHIHSLIPYTLVCQVLCTSASHLVIGVEVDHLFSERKWLVLGGKDLSRYTHFDTRNVRSPRLVLPIHQSCVSQQPLQLLYTTAAFLPFLVNHDPTV